METCPECGHIAYYDPYFNAVMCTNSNCGYMKRTLESNADHIRNMDDIELAKEFNSHQLGCPPGQCTHYLTDLVDHGYSCTQCWLDWLKQPYTKREAIHN